ncbi:MAG: hypothetical protein WCK89_22485 [bacterium]
MGQQEVFDAEVLPKEAVICLQQAGVEPESAQQLKAAFLTMFNNADQWIAKARAIVVTDVAQLQEMKQAKELRLKLRGIRCDAENARKRLKEDSLRRGKAIDGIANVLKALIEPAEAYLAEQETFAEREAAKAKAAVVFRRTREIAPYAVVFGNAANGMDMSMMSEEQFQLVLGGLKLQHEQKAEAERRAEAGRIERERLEREGRERLEADLARIRAEKERADIENARLRADAERSQAEAVAKERLMQEREAAKAAAAAEVERKRADQEVAMMRSRAEAELAERERLQAGIAARERAESAKAEEERLTALKAAQAPDRVKVLAFARNVRVLVVPFLVSDAGKEVQALIASQVEGFAKWIETKAVQAL